MNKNTRNILNALIIWFFILNPFIWVGQIVFITASLDDWSFIGDFFRYFIFPMYGDIYTQDVGQPKYFLATATIGIGILLLNLVNRKEKK